MPGVTFGSQLGGPDYSQTFTSFAGADIVPTFNERVIGEVQAITFSITREKAPVYTMGNADPRSFSRGKRGIAGSLVFTVFDRDALIEEMSRSKNASQGAINVGFETSSSSAFALSTGPGGGPGGENRVLLPDFRPVEATGPINAGDLIAIAPDVASQNLTNRISQGQQIRSFQPFNYADQIPPFHITITMANEYGQGAFMRILFAEILNEGMGFSIDDVVTEKACTFVARTIEHLKAIVRA